MTEPIAIADVIQIHPAHHSLGGALAFVTELRSWGIVAEVPVPGRGVAPVRLKPDEYRRIGHAGWEPVDPERAAQIAAHAGSDPLALWPLCSVCGKGPREGAHAGTGEWHDYQPGSMP